MGGADICTERPCKHDSIVFDDLSRDERNEFFSRGGAVSLADLFQRPSIVQQDARGEKFHKMAKSIVPTLVRFWRPQCGA